MEIDKKEQSIYHIAERWLRAGAQDNLKTAHWYFKDVITKQGEPLFILV